MNSDMDTENTVVNGLSNQSGNSSSSGTVSPPRRSPRVLSSSMLSTSGMRQKGRDSIIELDDTIASGVGNVSSDSVFNFDQNVTPEKTPKASSGTPDGGFKTPTSVRRALGMASSPQTPKNKAGNLKSKTPSSSTTSTRIEDGPSPYKSSRPSYLPKNVKLHKKKMDQRRVNLEIIRRCEADLKKTLAQANSPQVTSGVASRKILFDDRGTHPPLLNVFQPQHYFVNFDENSLRASDFVEEDSKFAAISSADDLMKLLRLVKWNPDALSSRECRYLTYLLTVTSDSSIVDTASPLIRSHVDNGRFFLGWNDVKAIVVNFGLTDCATPMGDPGPQIQKSPPRIWNLKFFYSLVQSSFHQYPTSKVMHLLHFLVDSFFEHSLVEIVWEIASLMQEVAVYLVSKSASLSDLVDIFDRWLFSIVHNRFIIAFLGSEPCLQPAMKVLSLRTVGRLLDVPEVVAESCPLEELLDLMTTEKLISLNVKEANQLLLICEKFCIMSGGFSPSNLKLARRLTNLAKVMHQASFGQGKHIDSTYFNEAAMRFEAFSDGFQETTGNGRF